MPLLIVHDISCYLWIVVLLRCEIFRIERFLSEGLPKVVLVRFHEENLSAHWAEPVDALWARATLSLIDNSSQARMLLFHYACGLLLRLSIQAELWSLVDSCRSIFLWSRRSYSLGIIEEDRVLILSLLRHLLFRDHFVWATSKSDGATQTSDGLSAGLRIVLIIDECLRVMHGRWLGLREAAHALLAQIVTRLAASLLRVYHFLQGFVLHRGKQPKTLSEEGWLGGILFWIRWIT